MRWDPDEGYIDAGALSDLDAVIHLAGAGIGDRRWTDAYRRTLLDSRVAGTGLISRAMAELDGGPTTLLSASAIGWYGDRGSEMLTESSSNGQGFLAEICRAWEAATAPAEAAGVRVAHLRTGIVVDGRGGALAKMAPLFKVGLGGRFGDGSQWMSWISIDDEVRAITHLLTSGVNGPVNLVAPHPVVNSEFAATLGSVLHRPARLPVPRFGPRLLLGREMADSLLFHSQRVLPGVLTSDGFEFDHPVVEAGLRSALSV